MTQPLAVPVMREISPSMRVDLLLSDWRAALPVELGEEEKERALYDQAWQAYLEGDYGFGLWCWHECDRLANAFQGSLREVTRVLGPGHYFGFSHRRAVAEKVPLERVYRPRKGDMSTPRTDAFILPTYQLLCVYEVKARAGDAKAKALLEIALGESEERRRADPYMKHFETFHDLINRPEEAIAAAPTPATAPTAPPTVKRPKRPKTSSG